MALWLLASLLLHGPIIPMDSSKLGSVTAFPTSCRGEPPLSLVMLMHLSPMHSWWPWWMVCPPNVFIEITLIYPKMYILMCQDAWAFFFFIPFSVICQGTQAFHLIHKGHHSLQASYTHPKVLSRMLNPVSQKSGTINEFFLIEPYSPASLIKHPQNPGLRVLP